MRKIKVLHIITRLTTGGAQRIAVSTAAMLDKERFGVTFASGPQDFCKEVADRWNMGVTIIPDLVREINPIKDLIALIRLYLFIRKNRFDIVHTYTSKAGILGRIAAKLAGVPIILHSPRGSIYHSVYYGRIAIFLLSRLENFAASFTDKIIACSENERRDYLEHKIGAGDKYITIYSGLNEGDFIKTYERASKRAELNIPRDAVLIGNIARLAPEKGHISCLEAFRAVVNRFPKAILLIAGDGPLREGIEAKIKELGLNNNVVMAGHRDDIIEILAILDISLHTSIWEGTPMAIIEAMFMGKAVIATNVGGIPELIEDGASGILVPASDNKALADAVIRLINVPALAGIIGEAARRRAKEKFTIESMMADINKLYDGLIRVRLKK